jgi:hypothetical protein
MSCREGDDADPEHPELRGLLTIQAEKLDQTSRLGCAGVDGPVLLHTHYRARHRGQRVRQERSPFAVLQVAQA